MKISAKKSQLLCECYYSKPTKTQYSRTSCKRPPKKLMSRLGGRLQEMCADQSLDHIRSIFFFTYGNCTAETYPCFTFFSYEKSISRKNKALPIENFPSLVLSRNVIMLQLFIIQFLLCYLPSGLPWEVKNKQNKRIKTN